MMRLGFGARLLVIFLTSMLALQLLGVGLSQLQRSRATDTGLRLPLPDQTAAIVELLEKTPRHERPLVLRAANGSDLRVSIHDARRITEPADWSEAPLAEFVLRRYLSALGPRDVHVRIKPSTELLDGPLRFMSWASPGSVEIEVGLSGGEYLSVSAEGLASLNVIGLPPGFWAGIAGALIAIAALLLLRRETKPLRRLADAVDTLDVGPDPVLLHDDPRSAPEIRGVVAAFNRLSERISALLRGRMALVGGISHDLRTYVTRLRLRAEAIPSSEEKERTIKDLDDMNRLLDDSLLAFSAGAPPAVQELVELPSILRSEAEEFRRTGRPVEIRFADDPDVLVLGDPVALRRLMANLIDNAIKYGTRAIIGLTIDSTEAVVTVDDEGPGIPEAERDRLLEPFVRREGSRNRATGGAGLGLSIARSVAASHGGTLSLETAPSGGVRVMIRLPLYRPETSI
jgi:signal transduction histidine kinase